MKRDNELYLVRATYKDMILSDYFICLKNVMKAVKRLTELGAIKIEYGIAPCRTSHCNWVKETVKEIMVNA